MLHTTLLDFHDSRLEPTGAVTPIPLSRPHSVNTCRPPVHADPRFGRVVPAIQLAMVTNYISIEFRTHDQGTTCHVRVRPSPQPRHTEDLSTPARRRVFYQRAENSTYPVSMTDLPDWLADRFGLGRA